jgi:hypothetical protein
MTTDDDRAQPIETPTMNAVVMGKASVTMKPAAMIKRLKMGPADTLMLPWFLAFFDQTDEDGYHEGRGQWSGLLSAAGVDQDDITDFSTTFWTKSTEERVALLSLLNDAVATFQDLLFAQALAPTVLYAGATGFLPTAVAAATTAHTAESLEATFVGLKVPTKRREGLFHVFADGRFVSIRPETVWYSTSR